MKLPNAGTLVSQLLITIVVMAAINRVAFLRKIVYPNQAG